MFLLLEHAATSDATACSPPRQGVPFRGLPASSAPSVEHRAMDTHAMNPKGRVQLSGDGHTGPVLRVVCISDTHEQETQWEKAGRIPSGDVLVHTGDFSNKGDLQAIRRFNEFLGRMPHAHKVVVCGNHDYLDQLPPAKIQVLHPPPPPPPPETLTVHSVAFLYHSVIVPQHSITFLLHSRTSCEVN